LATGETAIIFARASLNQTNLRAKDNFLKCEDLRGSARDVRNFQKTELYGLLCRVSPLESKNSNSDASQVGRRPLLAEYVKKPTKLRAMYKEKYYIARLRRDGTIGSPGFFAFLRFKQPSELPAQQLIDGLCATSGLPLVLDFFWCLCGQSSFFLRLHLRSFVASLRAPHPKIRWLQKCYEYERSQPEVAHWSK
jgi:hypothetical protein